MEADMTSKIRGDFLLRGIGRSAFLALPVVVAAGAAGAADFSGNYPITVTTTHPEHEVNSYCLSLVEDGSPGPARHGGTASIGGFATGKFIVDRGTVIAAVGVDDVKFVIAAPLQAGHAAKSSFLAMDDRSIAAAGTIVAGEKGSCTPFS
jgi:hypothetical protein